MQELLHQLGIDWKLLLSQAVNFGLLLIVLRVFLYKPLMKLLSDRKMKIEEGITKANEADRRLGEANEVMKSKLKEAEQEAIQILRRTEEKAKEHEAKLLEDARAKEASILQSAEAAAIGKAEEARETVRKEAAALVRQAIIRTVELSPDAVDEALVQKAIKEIGEKPSHNRKLETA